MSNNAKSEALSPSELLAVEYVFEKERDLTKHAARKADWLAGYNAAQAEIERIQQFSREEGARLFDAENEIAKLDSQADKLAKAEGLIQKLEGHLNYQVEWSKMNEYPEHEVRYHLCVDVPGQAMEALAEIEKFRKGAG